MSDAYERLIGHGLLPFYETHLRGRNTYRYEKEFQANQWQSPEEITRLQWTRLHALLQHAYTTVPYYREVFDRLGIRPEDITGPAEFARLPTLDKATLREHRERLLSSAFDPASLVHSATGGSTGEPLQFCYDRNSYERRVAAAMRGDAWAGWRQCAPEFYIWGVALLPQKGVVRWKKQLHHAFLRRSLVSSFDLSAAKIRDSVDQLNRTRPRVVIGYANAVYEFVRYARQAGLYLYRPQGVITSAEKLYPYQRAEIEAAFQSPVYDRYGCREVMMIGAECEQHSGLHVAADNLYVEVAREGVPCDPGLSGEVLLTDLHNYGMPLIRYRVGDVGSWKEGSCVCGRGLPLLNVVEGRTLGLISTPSGVVVSGEFFPHLLKDFEAIRAYKIIQESRDRLTVQLALKAAMSASEERLLQESIQRAVGKEMHIRWEMGKHIQIEREQKFRPVISHVPVEFRTDA